MPQYARSHKSFSPAPPTTILPATRPFDQSDSASGGGNGVIQRMCDDGHPDHPSGPCPHKRGAIYGYQSGVKIGEASSMESPPAPKTTEFLPEERAALAVMEEKQRLGKQAEHTGMRDLTPSATRRNREQSQPLLPPSDALRKHRSGGYRRENLAKSAGKQAVGKAIDKATGLPVTEGADIASTASAAVDLGPPTPSSKYANMGYERIPDSPAVEESYRVLPALHAKKAASKTAGAVGGFFGGLKGAVLGTAVLPGPGTIAGGIAGAKAGSKGASKLTDLATGANQTGEDAHRVVRDLHGAARGGDSAATAQLKKLGLDDDTIKAHDGYKAAEESLGI